MTNQGTDLVSKLLNMQQLEDEEELAYSASQQEQGLSDDKFFLYNICFYTHILIIYILIKGIPAELSVLGDGRPAWMKTLHQSATIWLDLLPKTLPVLYFFI